MAISQLFQDLIKSIYTIFCKLYNLCITKYENKFLKKSFKNNKIITAGYFERTIKFLDLENLLESRKIKINNYLYVYKLKEVTVNNLIDLIFDKNFRKEITLLTGFNYSIDYMIMYERRYIEKEKRDLNTLEQWYSYKWHLDKPNSNNTLKVIYPLNITSSHGPLSVIDQNSSKKLKSMQIIPPEQKIFRFTGELNKIYGFLPAKCIHKDGIPNKGKKAIQIMFQLNPHEFWAKNSKLNKRDPEINNKLKIWTNEPKFTFLTCRKDIRLKLDMID